MVAVVALLGLSGSGKTTTIEYLVSKLSRDGVKVGSVKHIHHAGFSMDTKGTDTWRHVQAGTALTVAIAPKEIVTIKKTDTTRYGLDQIIETFDRQSLDIVFVEGFHRLVAERGDVAKIIVAKNKEDLKEKLEGTAPPILAVTGRVATEKPNLPDLKIPLIDLTTEGEALVDIIKRYVAGNKN